MLEAVKVLEAVKSLCRAINWGESPSRLFKDGFRADNVFLDYDLHENIQSRHLRQQWDEIYIVSFRGKEFFYANYVVDGMNSLETVSRINLCLKDAHSKTSCSPLTGTKYHSPRSGEFMTSSGRRPISLRKPGVPISGGNSPTVIVATFCFPSTGRTNHCMREISIAGQ